MDPRLQNYFIIGAVGMSKAVKAENDKFLCVCEKTMLHWAGAGNFMNVQVFYFLLLQLKIQMSL
jgi:hypothetical protein